MIILDTNVISELTRPVADLRVVDWFGHQDPTDLATTTTSEAEILGGLAVLPKGKRKDGLLYATTTMLDALGHGVFSFDRSAAQLYPLIVLQRRIMGLKTDFADGQIAAIARSRHAAVATRNTGDFMHCGIKIINPWIA
jgi:predicted nucleic acid-binding protein